MMKTKFTLLFLLLSFKLFAQEFQLTVGRDSTGGQTFFESGNDFIILKDSMPNGNYKIYYDDSHNKIAAMGAILNNKKQGAWVEYYQNGMKKSSCYFENGFRDGNYSYWNNEGQLKLETFFKKGLINGSYSEFYKDGIIKTTGSYLNDLEEGEWISYFEIGNISERKFFKNGINIDSSTTYFESGEVYSNKYYSLSSVKNDILLFLPEEKLYYDSITQTVYHEENEMSQLNTEYIYFISGKIETDFQIEKSDSFMIKFYTNGQVKLKGRISYGIINKNKFPYNLTRLKQFISQNEYTDEHGNIISISSEDLKRLNFYKGYYKSGTWLYFDENGNLKKSELYVNGELRIN